MADTAILVLVVISIILNLAIYTPILIYFIGRIIYFRDSFVIKKRLPRLLLILIMLSILYFSFEKSIQILTIGNTLTYSERTTMNKVIYYLLQIPFIYFFWFYVLRFWLLYYKLEWSLSMMNNEWKSIINQDNASDDWFIKHRQRWGSLRFLRNKILIIVSVIASLCVIAWVLFWEGIDQSGVFVWIMYIFFVFGPPTLLLFYVTKQLPPYDDYLALKVELKYSCWAFISIMFILTIYFITISANSNASQSPVLQLIIWHLIVFYNFFVVTLQTQFVLKKFDPVLRRHRNSDASLFSEVNRVNKHNKWTKKNKKNANKPPKKNGSIGTANSDGSGGKYEINLRLKYKLNQIIIHHKAYDLFMHHLWKEHSSECLLCATEFIQFQFLIYYHHHCMNPKSTEIDIENLDYLSPDIPQSSVVFGINPSNKISQYMFCIKYPDYTEQVKNQSKSNMRNKSIFTRTQTSTKLKSKSRSKATSPSKSRSRQQYAKDRSIRQQRQKASANKPNSPNNHRTQIHMNKPMRVSSKSPDSSPNMGAIVMDAHGDQYIEPEESKSSVVMHAMHPMPPTKIHPLPPSTHQNHAPTTNGKNNKSSMYHQYTQSQSNVSNTQSVSSNAFQVSLNINTTHMLHNVGVINSQNSLNNGNIKQKPKPNKPPPVLVHSRTPPVSKMNVSTKIHRFSPMKSKSASYDDPNLDDDDSVNMGLKSSTPILKSDYIDENMPPLPPLKPLPEPPDPRDEEWNDTVTPYVDDPTLIQKKSKSLPQNNINMNMHMHHNTNDRYHINIGNMQISPQRRAHYGGGAGTGHVPAHSAADIAGIIGAGRDANNDGIEHRRTLSLKERINSKLTISMSLRKLNTLSGLGVRGDNGGSGSGLHGRSKSQTDGFNDNDSMDTDDDYDDIDEDSAFEEYKHMTSDELYARKLDLIRKYRQIAYDLWWKYVRVGAEYEINIDFATRKRFHDMMWNKEQWLDNDRFNEKELFDLFGPCTSTMFHFLSNSFTRFREKPDFSRVQEYLII